MFSKTAWFFTRIFCVYALFAFCFGYLLKPQKWWLGFVQLSIQPCLAICFFLVLFWLFKSKIRAFYPLAVLLLGYPFLSRTVQFHKPQSVGNKHDISVLSYNVNGFDSDVYYQTQQPEKTVQAIHFAADFDADVKCFQDFYNWDETPITGSIKRIVRKHTPYFVAAHPRDITEANQGSLGLIIFSKYPIKYVSQKMFNTTNGVLVADISLNGKKIRIINTQLQSTGVRVGNVVKANGSENLKRESKSLISSLKHGFENRFAQIKIITDLVAASPHPVILCGDLNEVPYGQAYGKLRKQLLNAFEGAGYGFGFTLNRSPRLVRIDHQFYSKSLSVGSFETLQEVDNSDHFPIYAEYNWAK
jgi:endonuclease/exonuclease/phosphatase family metal-dependent hydrolase